MTTTLVPGLAAEDAVLAGRDLGPEILSLWQRYQRARASRTASRAVLAQHRFQLGRRLLAVYARLRDDNGFTAWLRFHDIPHATAYRLMQKTANLAQPKPDAAASVPRGTLTPIFSGVNFTLDPHGDLTLDFTPSQAAAVRRAMRASRAAGEDQDTFAARICDALAALARDAQITANWVH